MEEDKIKVFLNEGSQSLEKILGDKVEMFTGVEAIDNSSYFIETTKALLESDIVDIDLDKAKDDVGVYMQLGMAIGCNLFIDIVSRIVDLSIEDVDKKDELITTLLYMLPSKMIYVSSKEANNKYLLGGMEVVGDCLSKTNEGTIDVLCRNLDGFESVFNTEEGV